jgi:hypothetical protein
MPASPSSPDIVWAEDHAPDAHKPAPRTQPPGYAQEQADQLLAKLPGLGRPRRYRVGWFSVALGVSCLSVAAVVLINRLDAAFLYTPTILLAAVGIRRLFLGVMGERR